MHFRYRRATLNDLPGCAALLRQSPYHDAATEPLVLPIWTQLLREKRMIMAIIEMADAEGWRLMAFGCTVFVADEFAAEIHQGLPPRLAAHVYRRHDAGDSPILSQRAVAKSNAGDGVTLLSLHMILSPRFVIPLHAQPFGRTMWGAFYDLHKGYRYREIIKEIYSRLLCDFNLQNGYALLRDYADDPENPQRPDARRLYLIGCTRKQAMARWGSALSELFTYAPPYFGFTPGEQELLAHALDGATDEDMAQILGISVSAVKQKWPSIYDRVDRTHPILLHPTPESKFAERSRTTQRRRLLLDYLRTHQEEIRPFQL